MAQQAISAHPLLNRIRERGYWRTVIRPTSFEPERITELQHLYSLVANARVRFSGWEYPHLGSEQDLQVGNDYVEQGIDWTAHREYWRFYQSGQFIHYSGMMEDWQVLSARWQTRHGGEPGPLLPVYDTIYRLGEMFHFAARLAVARSYNPTSHLHIELLLTPLQGRRLYNDSERYLRLTDHPATDSQYAHTLVLPLSDVVTDARKLALREAERVFYHFRWEPTPGLLERIVDEFVAS